MSQLPITDTFGSYLVDERRFSPYTARCYGADLRQYIEHLISETGIEINQEAEEAELRRHQAGGAGEVAGSVGPKTLTAVICEADADLIRGFLEHLSEKEYSPATMARKMSPLSSS